MGRTFYNKLGANRYEHVRTVQRFGHRFHPGEVRVDLMIERRNGVVVQRIDQKANAVLLLSQPALVQIHPNTKTAQRK